MKSEMWFTAVLVAGALAGPASAHEKERAGVAATPSAQAVQTLDASAADKAREYFTDSPLLTQDGKAVRFYSDVLRDRIVVLNVIYTNCKDACPLITHKLKEVRDALGESLQKKVHFISISSDPENDTPQALKAFARENDADDPNWTFLTGSKASIDTVLTRLGQLSRSPEEHSTLVIAGDVANKRWSKIRPDAPVAAISERLKLLAEPMTKAAAAAPVVR